MKILVISLEVWRDDNNGGNVLSNIFSDLEAEFAQVYCSSGFPQNNICKSYFQMTDAMAIKNILKKQPMGRKVSIDEPQIETERADDKLEKIKKMGNFEVLRIAREYVWEFSNYINEELEEFVLDFNPDIIFAPCHPSLYVLKLTRHIAKITQKPVISYVWDDVYTLSQFSLSPLYWFNRFMIRKSMRKTWPYYSLVYTMTEIQKNKMEKVFGRPMKILRKSCILPEKLEEKEIQYPIKMIYAGGVYLNRWRTLLEISKEIKRLNQEGQKMTLDIYTGNRIPKSARKYMDDGVNCRLLDPISQEELKMRYKESDIALHVESFDLKNRLAVRMSFSTKIVDCLESGCAIMAICDSKQGGFQYLKNEDAAICISKVKYVGKELKKICDNPSILSEYKKKAFVCGRKHHLPEELHEKIHKDLCEVMKNNFKGL